MILDAYKRPYNPKRPVLFMDESPRQLIAEAKSPIAAAPGQPARYDYEYRRCGTYNVFLVCEPLAGKRFLDILETKTKLTGLVSWKQSLINTRMHNSSHWMDNLNTHTPGALYETFPPEKTKALWDQFEFVYTPKHGSWLNMAEIELNVLTGQCLKRRIDNIYDVKKEMLAWQKARNTKNAKVNWQFTAKDARIKLKRLYPTLDS